MKILLDTCTFLWICIGDEKLSAKAKDVFLDSDNDVFLSAASCLEISIKSSIGKLNLPGPVESYIPEIRELHKIETLPISEKAALHVQRLPNLHKDPFDRLLIAQAVTGELSIVTPDDLIKQYGFMTIW